MQQPGWFTVPGLNSPEWEGAIDLVLSIDPGNSTGWCLARILPNELRVIATGTGDAGATLGVARGLGARVAHLIMEEPASAGTPSVQRLFGMFLEAVHQYAMKHTLELHIVRPAQWKQYPLKPRKEAEHLLTRNSGDLGLPSTKHERDALGMLAWWYLTAGKELVWLTDR